MRLIDADALKENIESITWYSINKEGDLVVGANSSFIPIYRADDIYNAIDIAPTVEYPFYQEAYQTGYQEGHIDGVLQGEKLYARPQGEWIFHTTHWTCSICNKTAKTIGYCGTENFMYEFFRFCPNCGADMRGIEK